MPSTSGSLRYRSPRAFPVMAPKLKVAIIGAGIGGLMLASCIAKMDKQKKIELDIYEAAEELAEIGAGINLWPRATEMLTEIGLEADILKLYERASVDRSLAFEFRKSDQSKGHPILDLYVKGQAFKIRRADLQKILLKKASTYARLHLSSKLTSYTEHLDSVNLEFLDGSKRTCHLLVGADGIKSTVRRIFLENRPIDGYQESIEPVWTGSYAYRGIVPREVLLKGSPGHRAARVPVMYIGKLKHILSYPMSDGESINIVGLVHDESQEDTRHEGALIKDVSNAEILSLYEGYEPEVQALLKCTPNFSKWAIHHLMPLKTYAERRVLLLGDAAHAVGPHQGSGAGQAMEDAYILSAMLTDVTGTPSPESQILLITHIYDAIRRPIGNASIEETKACGKLKGLTDDEKELPFVKPHDETVPHEVLVAYVKKSESRWRWLRDAPTRIKEQGQDAVKLLRSSRESKL
ncbi:salicylate hydroxylase [Amanita rubescens]|nr:salicylate hydroxylase [Amanita rubescens]